MNYADTPSCGPIPPCPTKRLSEPTDRYEMRAGIVEMRSQLMGLHCLGPVIRKHFKDDPDAQWAAMESQKSVGDLIDHLGDYLHELEKGFLGTQTDIYGCVGPIDETTLLR